MIEELQDYLAKEFNIHFDNPALLAEAFTLRDLTIEEQDIDQMIAAMYKEMSL